MIGPHLAGIVTVAPYVMGMLRIVRAADGESIIAPLDAFDWAFGMFMSLVFGSVLGHAWFRAHREDGELPATDPGRSVCKLCEFPGIREDADYCVFCDWDADRIPLPEDRQRFAIAASRDPLLQELRTKYEDVLYGAGPETWVEIWELEAEVDRRRESRAELDA
jgi:hypothetical protein